MRIRSFASLATFIILSGTFDLANGNPPTTSAPPLPINYEVSGNQCVSEHAKIMTDDGFQEVAEYDAKGKFKVTLTLDQFNAAFPPTTATADPVAQKKAWQEKLKEIDRLLNECFKEKTDRNAPVGDSCAQARDTYNKFTSEFTDKCSKAGLTGGVLDCFIRARACTYCRNSKNSDGICDKLANQDEGESFTDRLRKDSSGSADSGSARRITRSRRDELAKDERMFKICPSLAAKDAEAYSKKVERSEKNQEKREGIRDTDQEKLNELMAEKAKKLDELKEEVDATKSRLDARIKALEEALKNNRDAIIAKVQEIRMQIDAMGAQMTKLTNDMTKAGIDLFSAKATMFARCHTESIAKVTAIQNERSALAKQGKLSAGSTKNLLRSLGKSHAQKMQQLVKAFNKDCTSDPAYQNAVKIAEASYNLAMTQISQERARIEAARVAAEGAIAALQASIPDLAAKHLKAVANATTEAYNSIEKLRLESIQLEQFYATPIALAQLKLFNSERTVAKIDAELDHERNMLELRDQYSGGRSGPEAGTIPAMDTLTLMSSVNGFWNACCNVTPMQGTNEECTLAQRITSKADEIEDKMPNPSVD